MHLGVFGIFHHPGVRVRVRVRVVTSVVGEGEGEDEGEDYGCTSEYSAYFVIPGTPLSSSGNLTLNLITDPGATEGPRYLHGCAYV